MLWAYVLENGDTEDVRNNQPLFLLINDLDIEEENLIFDTVFNGPELKKLLEDLQPEDRLLIRSVEDIADNLTDLTSVFQILTDKQISLCSCKEAFLSGEDYLDGLSGFEKLYVAYEKKKQDTAYSKALEEGRVGRPAKTIEIEKALAMYQSGNYKISQIESLTGISKSTIYRYLKND